MGGPAIGEIRGSHWLPGRLATAMLNGAKPP
jgi:hypothetical protein